MRKFTTILTASALLALGACAEAEVETEDETAAATAERDDGTVAAGSGEMAEDLSIAESVQGSSDLSAFNDALGAAGLAETLGGVGPYTVFAPSNGSFEEFDEMVSEGGPALVNFLSGHIVPGTITAADLQRAVETGGGSAELATMSGAILTVREGDGGLVVSSAGGGEARVTGADNRQTNGVIHIVDGVLQPR